jgi:hypothetical protein
VQRGDLFSYVPVIPRPGISIVRLIVSAETINDSQIPWVLGAHLIDDDPASLLAPRIGDHGWAMVTTIERVMRSRLGEQAGVATPDEMQQVDIALKACLDLD